MMPLYTRYFHKPEAIRSTEASFCNGTDVETWTDFACGADDEGKPNGRWFCIGRGDDWKIYVRGRVAAGDWDDESCLKFHTQVIFRPTATLRKIDDRADMEGFTRQYATKRVIDWMRVGKEF